MGVLLNHAVAYLTSPLSIGMTFLAAGAFSLAKGWRKTSFALLLSSFALLWFFSSGLMLIALGARLEKMYPPRSVEELPCADAVVVLGGGVGACTNSLKYAEMYTGADRVAHAARIMKAGKAPVVVVSGSGEEDSSVPLLMEAGVPREAIIVEAGSRNTEENARFVGEMLKNRSAERRILLVTSSWHMRRALLMFSRHAAGAEVIPAATDYEALVYLGKGCDIDWFIPSAETLYRNTMMLKEYVGYWGYRLLR